MDRDFHVTKEFYFNIGWNEFGKSNNIQAELFSSLTLSSITSLD